MVCITKHMSDRNKSQCLLHAFWGGVDAHVHTSHYESWSVWIAAQVHLFPHRQELATSITSCSTKRTHILKTDNLLKEDFTSNTKQNQNLCRDLRSRTCNTEHPLSSLRLILSRGLSKTVHSIVNGNAASLIEEADECVESCLHKIYPFS